MLILSFLAFIGLLVVMTKFAKKKEDTYDRVLTNANSRGISMIKQSASSTKLEKLRKKRKKFKTATIVIFVIALVFFCSMISDIIEEADNIEGGVFVNIIVFGVLIPCCITFFKTNRLIKKIETYQNLILIRDMYDTQKLADYLGCGRNEVLDFITYMIREGYLELEIKNDNLIKPKEYIDPAQVFSMICQNCGANNQYVKGKHNKCEYCGSVLNLDKI